VSVVFPNGSTVVGLPENEEKIRGFSDVRLLLVDEASTVDEALYEAVTPMLAVSNGTMWLLSTPRGPRGFFYREWTGREPWVRLSVPAAECPRFSKEFLDEERRRKDRRTFRQEYLCEFVDDHTCLFLKADRTMDPERY
jgi:hypothetical protein